ncbi:PepSY domain-containing protein [Thalassovita sp.]|uniref:PepSY domain-containing protein n=1 Tax=Thalassovita sp. TaxID=1979401 RepID=UPI002B274BC2|nr:PepSY domain-containing protein [Thalassovita sp.]
MKTIIKALGFGLVMTLSGLPALAAQNGVTLTPEIRAQIVEKLTNDGYEVRKIKVEDGYYEAYALKDGKKLELYLDAALKVMKTKGND